MRATHVPGCGGREGPEGRKTWAVPSSRSGGGAGARERSVRALFLGKCFRIDPMSLSIPPRHVDSFPVGRRWSAAVCRSLSMGARSWWTKAVSWSGAWKQATESCM